MLPITTHIAFIETSENRKQIFKSIEDAWFEDINKLQ